ncbi:hypothetical protein FHT79_001775 [Rhizobium sp. BK212]|uniref:hypothetical protein n=1 Tax=Rhizobium sp. BK212 TaxID=2587074 RepID=UPI0017E807EC|nr:hypothetical protein [Rhizobium sp. BK212]
MLDACINSIRDEGLSKNLLLASTSIFLAEAEYLARGPAMTLFSIPGSDNVPPAMTTADMKRVYAGTFVKSKVTRGMYDLLKAAPRNDMCPLCSQRTVSTLDHYLAQALHPALTVVPLNLIPACAECNKLKLDYQPSSEAQQSFHPYFDDFDDAQWLVAEVIETSPAAVRFWVASPAGWSATKVSRAVRHFEAFHLGSLYASHAGVEISNIRYSLARIAGTGTPHDVRLDLHERAESARHFQLNSWQTATYQALAASDWFCAGGFRA